MAEADWIDVGAVDELAAKPISAVLARRTPLAVVWRDGRFSVLSGRCNHVGGPLGEGHLDGDYVVCPGTIGSFIGRPGRASRATRTTGSRATRSKSKTGACWSISPVPPSGPASLTSHIRWRGGWRASPARCG